MKLITQLSDLKTVSGGYYDDYYDEFVTENTIFYNSVASAMFFGLFFGALGGIGGYEIARQAGAIVLGALAAGAGACLGYNYNAYADIKPNSWVTWNVEIYY